MTTKICTKCGLPKDISEYSWSIHGIKRHSACNECRAKEQSDYYERTKPQQLKYKAERQVVKREEARHFVFNYLSSHPCVDCGNADLWPDEKEDLLDAAALSFGIVIVLEETKKRDTV